MPMLQQIILLAIVNFLILLSVQGQNDQTSCTSDDLLLYGIFDNSTYNKFSHPRPIPVGVSLEIQIQEITAILEASNEVEMDIYVTEYWNDPRLNFSLLNPCRKNMSVSHQVFDRIWSPNTGFINSHSVEIHESPFRNLYMIMYQNGSVRLNYRVKVKAPCVVNLRSFPMDNLSCRLQYESFSYNIDHVRLTWSTISHTPVIMLNDIYLAGFTLKSINHDVHHNLYPGGVWDELRLTFEFQREHVWYIVYIYVPTFLSVLIGWFGICLGLKAISARAVLCLCSFVSLIIIFTKIMTIVPHSSYLKAIDVWILALLTFSAFTVLELAVIGCFATEKSGGHRSAKSNRRANDSEDDSILESVKRKKKITFRKESVYYNCTFFTLERMDKFALYILPTIFVLFNIIYWSYYAPQHDNV